jgi:alkylation response protein AidB-like acyl-CoA dehydrogenase
MDLTLGPEQETIRDSIRGLLDARLPLARVRALAEQEPGVDDAAWREAASLGWFGLGLPEAAGGAGYGLPEEMILFVELGRSLAPGPWLGTLLAAHALGGRGADVVGGRRRAALIDDPRDALGAGAPLDGTVRGIADAGAADGLLVLGARRVRWIATDARGVGVRAAQSIDPTRRLAVVTFEGAAAETLDADPEALRRAAVVLVAAEAVGVAERTLEMSVAYAKVRQQFGRPIGSFQAVKHRCADMAVRAEVARSAVTWAVVAARDGEGDVERHVHAAKALAGGAALTNASENVQNHGGIGYTWEADPHLYLKRAWLLEQTLGARSVHLDALAARWRGGA